MITRPDPSFIAAIDYSFNVNLQFPKQTFTFFSALLIVKRSVWAILLATYYEEEREFFDWELETSTLMWCLDGWVGKSSRSAKAIRLRQVTFDRESVKFTLLKPSFCSGLKKSYNLSRNLKDIQSPLIILLRKRKANPTVHRDCPGFVWLLWRNPTSFQ